MLVRFGSLLGWLGVAAAVAAALLVTSRAAAQTEPPADVVLQGRRLFAEQCATCHGAEGQGGDIPGSDQLAPPLAGPEAPAVTLEYVDLVMRTGRMPPPENEPFDNRARRVSLTDEQREAVNAYLQTELGVIGEIPAVAGGDATSGQQVFATNCAPCHGSTGAGGVAGAGAWTPPVNSLDDITLAEAIRVGPFEMPAFSPEQITDAEIGDVTAFLDEVEDQTRTPLGLIELNPVYAAGYALLFVLVVLIIVRTVAGKPAPLPDPEGQHGESTRS